MQVNKCSSFIDNWRMFHLQGRFLWSHHDKLFELLICYKHHNIPRSKSHKGWPETVSKIIL